MSGCHNHDKLLGQIIVDQYNMERRLAELERRQGNHSETPNSSSLDARDARIRNEALEEAARVCEARSDGLERRHHSMILDEQIRCAHAIRALKSTPSK